MPNAARLTVVETVVHQQTGENPIPVTSQYSRTLSTDEQPYGPRKFKVTKDWQPLDTGWIKECGMLVLKNHEGENLQVKLSETEKVELSKMVVEVCCAINVEDPTDWVPFALLPPRESLRFQPHRIWSLRVRCTAGEVRCSLTAFPS